MRTTDKLVVYGGMALALLLPATSSLAQVQHFPVSDFVNAQGPLQIIAWTDPVNGDLLAFDHFGKRNTFFGLNLGTSVSGDLSIRDLGNGREHVSVDLHTDNAVCWGFDVNGNPAFGRSPVEVSQGAPASLGNAHTTIDFSQPSGAPLPTIGQIFGNLNGVIAESLKTSIQCPHGELRPSGATGFAQTTQTGVHGLGLGSFCPPEKDADCFPAEKIQFKPTGQ